MTSTFGNTVKFSIYLPLTIIAFSGCSTPNANTDADNGAIFEGFAVVSLNPMVKLNWPDLSSFDINKVDGRDTSSSSKIDVPAGQHKIEVSASSRWHGDADHLTLFVDAKAGHVYLIRPVYHHYAIGDQVDIEIIDRTTKDIVSKTW
jgi:hypothetical protein